MKRTTLLTIALLLVLATAAHAQFFGQLGPLGPRSQSGLNEFGAFMGFGSGTSIAATGEARMGLGKQLDLGLQVGIQKLSNSGPTGFGAQLDSRIDLFRPIQGNENFKVGGDIAAGFSHMGSTSYTYFDPISGQYVTVDGGGGSIFHVSAVPCASITGPIGNGQAISGWGGVGFELDAASGNTATSAVIRIGGQFEFTRTMGVTAEWNHATAGGGGDAFMVGVNFFKAASRGSSKASAPAPAPAKKGTKK